MGKELCPTCKPVGRCLFKEIEKRALDAMTPKKGGVITEAKAEGIREAFSEYLEAAVELKCEEAIKVKSLASEQEVSPIQILRQNKG